MEAPYPNQAAQIGMGQAQALRPQHLGASPKEPTFLDEIQFTVSEGNRRLNEMIGQLRQHVDSVHGVDPLSARGDTPAPAAPVSESAAGRVRQQLMGYAQLLNQLEQQVSRVRTI